MTTTVIVRRVDTAETIVATLDDDDSLSSGYGGWTTLDRPRRRAAVAWTGTPAATYTLPLALDGMEAQPGVDRSVEPSCRLLETWGRSPDPTVTPPVLQVIGELLVPVTSGWVLQDLVWGARERASSGERIRQVVTLTLLQTDDPVVAGSPAAKVRQNRGGNAHWVAGPGTAGAANDPQFVPGPGTTGSSGDAGAGSGPWPGSHTGNGGKGNGGKGWPSR